MHSGAMMIECMLYLILATQTVLRLDGLLKNNMLLVFCYVQDCNLHDLNFFSRNSINGYVVLKIL